MRYKRNHSKAQSAKTKFRRSAKWTKFRRTMKAKQKVDPITGSPLAPTCSVHHLDMREENYEDLSDETHFVEKRSLFSSEGLSAPKIEHLFVHKRFAN